MAMVRYRTFLHHHLPLCCYMAGCDNMQRVMHDVTFIVICGAPYKQRPYFKVDGLMDTSSQLFYVVVLSMLRDFSIAPILMINDGEIFEL